MLPVITEINEHVATNGPTELLEIRGMTANV